MSLLDTLRYALLLARISFSIYWSTALLSNYQFENYDFRHSTEQNRQEQQEKTTAQAEKTRRFLEKKRKLLAKKRGLKIEDIQIPETDIVIDLPAPKPLDRTEMNIDRNIQTAKKASREWDKDKVS